MTTTQNPLVIGIFQDADKAKQALAELNGAGFAKDQLGFADTDGETANTNLGSELMKFGVPQEHAGYYHNAFQAGQHVVSVRADGREQDAARILSNYGATGLNSDPNAGAAMPNDASQMAAYNTYADPSQNPANQAPAYNAGNYNNADTGMANQQQYNDPNFNNSGMANADQQQYNDPNFNNAGYANNDQQQYANPNYNNGADQQQQYANPNYNNQNYNNMGTGNTDQSFNNADQQQYNNSVNQQQFNDPNYNNQNYSNGGSYANNDQQQYNNNAGYANNDQRYNDPNQGFNQAQNYDPNAFQNNDPNARQERRTEREERRMEREDNNF